MRSLTRRSTNNRSNGRCLNRDAMPKYTIKSHPTRYRGCLFRSRLEARWAAFFDLAGWEWEYEPFDFDGWTPDFRVSFPCSHSECSGEHTLFVEVKPYLTIENFKGHRCLDFPYGQDGLGGSIPADASAAFGNNPSVTMWEMCHGAGGGEESVEGWVNGNLWQMWNTAGEMTRYRK